jgi:hypothetical protein
VQLRGADDWHRSRAVPDHRHDTPSQPSNERVHLQTHRCTSSHLISCHDPCLVDPPECVLIVAAAECRSLRLSRVFHATPRIIRRTHRRVWTSTQRGSARILQEESNGAVGSLAHPRVPENGGAARDLLQPASGSAIGSAIVPAIGPAMVEQSSCMDWRD